MPTGLDAGTYDVRVAVATGSSGYVYDSRPFSIRGSDAKFILKLSPPYLPPIVQGGQGTITINTRSVGTTAANVTLYVDGLAPGITASFSPSNLVTVAPGGSGSATLTLSVSNKTPPGPYPVSIRGVSGSEAAVVPLGFGVMPNIGAGEGHATITINPPRARPGEHIGISGAGFTNGSTITLTAAPPGAPTPIDITPGSIQVQTDGTWASEITIPEAGQVPPGTYIIKAADGTIAAKNTFSIVPAENADFFLNVSPQFLKIVRGESGNTTLTLSSKNGFKESISFGVGHLTPGVTATFKDTLGNIIGKYSGMPGGIREVSAPTALTPIPGEDLTVTVLIEVDGGTPIGPYDIALEAGTSTIFRAVPLGLMVVSPGASMVISPMSGPADTDIRLSGTGFTAGETVTVTFAGNSITTVPSTITVAEDGTFTALITSPSMTAGIYPVKVTGAASGTTIDRPFGLKPSAVNTFVLYANPALVNIPKGGSGSLTAKVEPSGSFQSAVALSVSGLSVIPGATANFTPSSTVVPSIATPTTATLTINVPAGATEGKYPLTLTAAAGGITQTRKITLNVVPPVDTPDFSISVAPDTVPVNINSNGTTSVIVTSINGFTGTVDLAVTMSADNATWPSEISYVAGSVTPSATTGLGKQAVTFTASSAAQPGSWTFKITGTSGSLERSTEVMVICTPSGTTVTPYSSPRLDPTTITASTPMELEAPWGDKVSISNLINDGSEASVITPSKIDVTPGTLGSLPSGASDMLGRITNIESSAPVAGVEWNLGFPFSSTTLAAAGLGEENLKVAYLNPDTGTWTEVTTTIDTTNKVAYASPDHFSSWTLIATPAPPPSSVVTEFSGGGGGGGGLTGVTNVTESVSDTGRFTEDVTASSADGKVELTINKDTIGKNRSGSLLHHITVKEADAPPSPPEASEIIGLVYDLGPTGATFDPPVTLTFTYSTDSIPEGVDEKNLVIAYWDKDNSEWVELENITVDLSVHVISGQTSHFTAFSVIAYSRPASFTVSDLVVPAEVDTGESVSIGVTVTNTGDLAGSYEVTLTLNNITASTQKVTLSGQSSQKVTLAATPDSSGYYSVSVNGLSGSFTVKQTQPEPTEAPPATAEGPSQKVEPPPEQSATPEPTTISPSQSPQSPKTSPTQAVAPESTQEPASEPAQPVPIDWNLFTIIAGIIAGSIGIGIIIWRLVTRKKSP